MPTLAPASYYEILYLEVVSSNVKPQETQPRTNEVESPACHRSRKYSIHLTRIKSMVNFVNLGLIGNYEIAGDST
jgi:hypothetical protein